MSKKALFNRLALIGVGLIGSSIARAARLQNAVGSIVATARSPATRKRVAELGLADQVVETNAAAVEGADLVIVCIPVGACGPVAKEIGPHLAPGAIVSDVGSVKGAVVRDMTPHLPMNIHFVPAHPVAGTEYSGPDAGFAELFVNRWCILTPPQGTDPAATEKLAEFWRLLGANVDTMAPDHHDLVLAITSHLPHLIAYTIVSTADELQTVTRSEVLKFSAGGFRDFTRIAASDPTMWRDVFLANKDAVLEMLGRFNEDVSLLTKAIRRGDGDTLIRSLRADACDPQRHRRYWPGFAGTRFRPPASRSAARAAAEALCGGGGLEQRRHLADRNRPHENRPVIKPQRQRHRLPALERRRLAEHGDARADIGAGLRFCDAAEAGQQPVERAGELVHAGRGLHHLRRADRLEERIQARNGDAQLPIQPAIGVEHERAAADRDRFALLHARVANVDAAAGRLQLAKARRPRLGREILQTAQVGGDVGIDRLQRGRMQGRRRGVE